MSGTEFEREWRLLLIKRLRSAQAALRRDEAIERKQMAEAQKLAAGYESFEDAHEAYGWGDITQNQLDAVQAIFEGGRNRSASAHARISIMISALGGEIEELYGNGVQEDMMRRYEERKAAGQ
jgi:hypothetical protein